MLIRFAIVPACVLALAARVAEPATGQVADCANDMHLVREALARDQNLADQGRQAVDQLLRDAGKALAAGEQAVCIEMMEDAKELLGLDAAD